MLATRAANKSVVTFTLFAGGVIVARLTGTVVTARCICTRNSFIRSSARSKSIATLVYIYITSTRLTLSRMPVFRISI